MVISIIVGNNQLFVTIIKIMLLIEFLVQYNILFNVNSIK